MLFEKGNESSYSIIHGSMGFFKFALDTDYKQKFKNPADFLFELIKLHPNKTFLMAPSNYKQINNINF